MTSTSPARPAPRAARQARAARRRGLRASAILVLASALALTGCVTTTGAQDLDPGAIATPSPTATATPSPSASPAQCTDDQPLRSYAPAGALPAPGAMPAGSTMADIVASGQLVVGVSADTLLMGARDPLTGQIEGFDIDVLHEVSEALFGDANKLQFKVITSAQRLPVLQQPVAEGGVDIVARTLTINCSRWQSIAFSAEYFQAGQKVLVPSSDETTTSIADLAGKKVCAPEGTTTIDRLAEYPEVVAVGAATHTGCLVLFQQGQVDAITGDDTILAGFAAQDPYAKVVGEAISSEPYGLGMRADDVDLVQFVNGVLERMKSDGTWTALYDKWLGVLGPAPVPPVAQYGR